jgi:hypothetical protein
MRHPALLVVLALVAAVLLQHGAGGPMRYGAPVRSTDLMPDLRATGGIPGLGQLELVGAWQLTSTYRDFGNFSALRRLKGGTILALSDRNDYLEFVPPDRPGPFAVLRQGVTMHGKWGDPAPSADAEAFVVDPANQDIVLASEGVGELYRFSPDLVRHQRIPVPELAEWPENKGPEAMALLHDGRLVILGETYTDWDYEKLHPGLVFAGIPDRAHPQRPGRFTIAMPAGFRPVELEQLPDGRLLMLGRSFSIAGFRNVIALVDPRAIRAGATVPTQEIARIDDPRIRDNYEGMAVTTDADGKPAIWIISDSNLMVRLQRTLLLKLRFRAAYRISDPP